jgi:hypothetical protein
MSTAGKPPPDGFWPAFQGLHKQLEEAVAARKASTVERSDLDALDSAVYVAAKGLFIRYIDVAGWREEPQPALAQFCVDQLRIAQDCIDPRAYSLAQTYFESVSEKVRLVSQIAAGSSIEEVLTAAISCSRDTLVSSVDE